MRMKMIEERWLRCEGCVEDMYFVADANTIMTMPTLPPPTLSQHLRQVLDSASTMHRFIADTALDSFTPASDEIILVASLYSLVEEHHGAILYLLGAGQFDGSAFSLARPLIESGLRAHWIYSCAKPEHIQQIRTGKENVYPPLRNMAEEIEKQMQAGGIFEAIIPGIKSLHEFTHGGLEQLLWRFDSNGNIRPSFSDDDRRMLVDSVTAHFTMLSIAWCQLSVGSSANGEIRAASIGSRFSEIYPIG